jgi:hypothetical protein
MHSVEPKLRIRMQNAWDRNLASRRLSNALPSGSDALIAVAKHAPPQALQPMPENVHRPEVPRQRVVSIEALQNAPQPSPDLWQRLVHPAAQRQLILLQLGHHPLIRRLPPDHEPALRTGATVVDKSEESERLRFLIPTLAPVLGREPAELQQPRLLRMEFQPKLRQPLPELLEEQFRIGAVLSGAC